MKQPSRTLGKGKLPISVLSPILDSIERGRISVVPASIGIDVGITRTRGRYLVSSSDPITGAERNIGWHAVHVSANDVATSGIMPDSLDVVMLFPEGTEKSKITSLMKEVRKTARKLGIIVCGGHTEITPGLVKPIVVTTCFGSGDKFVTSENARAGDAIVMTKTAAIEGTSILCTLPGVKPLVTSRVLNRGKSLIKKLSIIPEAKLAFSEGYANAMHDVTEGGVLGAVYEMSLASNLGFQLESERVLIDSATREICRATGCDPLRLIGSGSLLISCDFRVEQKLVNILGKNKIACSIIGRFNSSDGGRTIISRGVSRKVKEADIQDELWRALSKYGEKGF